MTRVICDFETASDCDLKVCGAAVYSEHWSTEVLCLVWRIEGGSEFGVWSPLLPEYADAAPLRALAENPDIVFVSHSSFEQFIWMNLMVPQLGMPPLPPERWQDTQATAAWLSLPLALEKLCKVLDLPVQKDMEGSRLTIGLSRTNKKTGMYDRSPETLRRVVEYCKTDVAGEEAVLRRLGNLSSAERKVWLLDQEINQRGIRLDMEFVRQAQLVCDRASVPLLEEFRDLTSGVNPGQVAKVIEWCAGNGVELENLQKGYLAGLLGESEDDGYESLAEGEDDNGMSGVELSGAVRRVLGIRQMLGSSSIKKLARMQRCVGADGRARGLLQYHAAHPGRWSGRLLQPQNFPRGIGLDPGEAVEAIMAGDPKLVERALGVPAIEAVASSLRFALVAEPGKVLEAGDFVGVEMRVALALAGQQDKCELLATGKDVYLDMACDIYSVPRGSLTKADIAKRTIGKNTVLGCGFQMGAPKFHERYCPDQPLSFAEDVVRSYREVWAPKVPALWGALKGAVNECVRYGRRVETYGCVFRRAGAFMAIDLPSGWQTIWYYQPHLHDRGDYGPAPAYWAMKGGKWTRIYLYGGLLCENIVQALDHGLLVSAMGRITNAGMPIVLTVHDEVVAEVDEGAADLGRFEAIMAEPTVWSDRIGIPVAVEAWQGNRYRK